MDVNSSPGNQPEAGKRLTSGAFWESHHTASSAGTPAASQSRLKSLICRRLGAERLARYGLGYSEHHFWNALLPRFIAPKAGARVLEVGCAPGGNLIQFHRLFGYTPYGLEYTQSGVDLTRRLFVQHGLDPGNVIHNDFFSEAFQKEYAGSFEVVLSRGFIEHFEDPVPVLEKHLNLLSPGGTLILTIPNFRGLNYCFGWFLMRDLYPLHNLKIMALAPFRQLMCRPGVSPLFCGYQGILSLRLFDTRRDTGVHRLALPVLRKADYLLGMLLDALCGGERLESRFTSPHLVFVGVKQAPIAPL
jgi:SAM-dependent methyltransferase